MKERQKEGQLLLTKGSNVVNFAEEGKKNMMEAHQAKV